MTRVSTRLSLVTAALHLGFGAHLPFFGLWLAERGLTANEIALVVGAPLFARVLGAAPLTAIADQMGDPVLAIRVLSVLVCLLYGAIPFVEGFPGLLLVSVTAGLLWGTVAPLSDALTIAATRTGEADYGRVRLWGSFSFILTASVMGVVIERVGLWIVPPMVVLSLLLLMAAVGRRRERSADPPRSMLDGARVMARDPVLLLLLVAAACGHAAHGMFYTIGGVHWRSLGYSEAVIGFLWAVGVIAEIGLFAISTLVLKRVGTMALLAIGLVAGTVRWAVMAVDPPLGFLFVWQALHAGSFACVQAAGIQVVASRFPPALPASGQGAYFAIVGTFQGLAMIASGPLYASFAGQAYLSMAMLCLAGLALVTIASRREAAQPQRSGSGG